MPPEFPATIELWTVTVELSLWMPPARALLELL